MLNEDLAKSYVGKFVEFCIKTNGSERICKGRVVRIEDKNLILQFWNSTQIYSLECITWIRDFKPKVRE
jgi:hypothetical protein